jgi:preprotein translocase subunit SecF
MELFKEKTHIDFLGRRKLAAVLSIALILISIGSLVTRGLNFGLDFTGGTLIEAAFSEAVDLSSVRSALAADFSDAQLQYFGSSHDVLVRLAPRAGENSTTLSNRVLKALGNVSPAVEMRRVEYVGPQVGEELREQGALAMLYALLGIIIYVAVRFQYRFAIGAVASLVHDVIITIGVFSLFQLDFDLTVLAAILAIIGYSLNDTIVVFDRIRENFRKVRRGSPEEIMNMALNETLSRTIMTGLTTLLVIVSLAIFGGDTLYGFSMALIVGIIVGTYSSVYIASAMALALGVSKQDLVPARKDDVEDARPWT